MPEKSLTSFLFQNPPIPTFLSESMDDDETFASFRKDWQAVHDYLNVVTEYIYLQFQHSQLQDFVTVQCMTRQYNYMTNRPTAQILLVFRWRQTDRPPELSLPYVISGFLHEIRNALHTKDHPDPFETTFELNEGSDDSMNAYEVIPTISLDQLAQIAQPGPMLMQDQAIKNYQAWKGNQMNRIYWDPNAKTVPSHKVSKS